MATLQKFKLFATQCGKSRSPTRSPRKSPMVPMVEFRRRRRTTLRMLLSRNDGRQSPPRRRNSAIEKEEGRQLVRRNSLKELFVCSPEREEEIPTRQLGTMVGVGGSVIWSHGPGSPKPVSRVFRIRSLLKRGWRPVLDTVFE